MAIQWMFWPDLGMNGVAWDWCIQLNSQILGRADVMNYIARHEYGHMFDKYVLTSADKAWFMHKVSGDDIGLNDWPHNYAEPFADAVRDWINTDGQAWPELTPILTRGWLG